MANKNNLPRVFKSKDGIVEIVYRNKIEIYKLDKKYTKTQMDADDIKNYGEEGVSYDYDNIYGKGWNAYHEIDMMKGNGFREVRIGETAEAEQSASDGGA